MKPTAIFNLHGSVEIMLFGQDTGFDWQIKPLREKDGDKLHPELFARFAHIANAAGVKILNAPVPTLLNGNIVKSVDEYTQLIGDPERFAIRQGIESDGSIIPAGEAYWLSSADTLLMVLLGLKSRNVVGVNLGLKSMMPGNAISNALSVLGDGPREIQVFLVGGVSPKYYIFSPTDVKYGLQNRQLIANLRNEGPNSVLSESEGRIWLAGLAMDQLRNRDVPRYNIAIGGIEPHDDVDKDGKHLWYSTIRSKTSERNGFMVRRKW